MSFFDLLSGLFGIVKLADELSKLANTIGESIAKANEELSKQIGSEIRIYPAYIKTPKGPRLAIIVDTPGKSEDVIEQILNMIGVEFVKLQCDEKKD